MRRTFLACLLFVLSSSCSFAEPAWFFSVSGSLVSFDGQVGSVEPINASLQGGLSINQYIDIGVESNTTLSDDDISGVDFEVDLLFVFIKAKLPISEGTNLYAVFGSSSVELVQGSGRSALIRDDSDTGIGFGAQFLRDGGDSAFLIEYISYYDDDQFDGVSGDTTIDGLNFGYVSYF